MTASQLIKRARSLSDTPNSLFISHEDEVNSLHESWKDIYSQITDSSDDYYVSSVILSTVGATQLGTNEWELTIPSDVYKLRFVDWKNGGNWDNMYKFNTNNRNARVGNPQYRWRGNKLWIVGSILPGEIRIDYYPPPIVPSVPEVPWSYALDLATYNRTSVKVPNYFSVKNPNLSDPTDYCLYVYNGNIVLESYTLQTKVTLLTGSVAQVLYYLGYVYYRTAAGAIYRATTDFVSTLVPTLLVSGTTNVSVSAGLLYYSTSVATFRAQLDGSAPSQVAAFETRDACMFAGILYTIKASDSTIYMGSTSLGIVASHLTSDNNYVYYSTLLGDVHKIIPLGTYDEIIAEATIYIGAVQNNFLAMITDAYDIVAASTFEDTDFVYPINEANELMAYQSAMDFKRKQLGDITALELRLNEIRGRFADVLRRDEGQPERRMPEIASFSNY